MKIEIITFHNTSNFGATLQCTALSYYLKQMGHEVEVIDYLPQYVLDKKSVWKELKKAGKAPNKAKALLKGILYIFLFAQIRRRDRKFEEFISGNLSLSKRYRNAGELLKDPPRAGLYICGSDQVWNPALTGGVLDPAFFLRFAQGSRRASYGVSLGELNVEQNAEELMKLTDDYIGVSVRERSMALRLAEAIGKEVMTVPDCTLLLDKKDYRQFEKKTEIPGKPYLLLYNLLRSDACDQIAAKIAREKGLSIVNITPNPFIRMRGTRNRIDIGPGEFLYLFRNAEYVVTNSFHGTIFSIIYEKQFTSIPHAKRPERVIDLLEMLGLEGRMSPDPESICMDDIDYAKVRERLLECRKVSCEYLTRITGTEHCKLK